MKRINVIIIGAALVLGLSACSVQPKKLTRISIASQEWVGYGPFYLAQEKGFFVQDGIEVFFIDEELDSNRRDAFKAGILDCEVGTIDLLVSKRAQNTPVIAVLELDCSFGGDAIVADKSIKSLNDLIGKRIVFSRDDVSETFISYLFHKKGLSLKDISIITRPPDKVADVFLGKEAEAVVTWEPWVTRALARPGAHILVSTRQTPEVIIDTLNVREDFLKNNPQAVSALMRGWFKAIEYLKDHPEEGSRIIARHYKITPLAYRQSIERLKWIGYKEQIDPSQAKARKEIFDLIAQLKFNNGRISKLPDSENSFDSVLIRKIYENSQ